MDAYDAIVVGSGPNGLTAGVVLAREGWSVLVVEGGETVGGGTRTGELTLAGFRHDLCSAVHPMAAGSPVFRELGLVRPERPAGPAGRDNHPSREGEGTAVELLHPELPLAHPLDDGGAAVLARGFEETGDTLGAGDGRAWRSLMEPVAGHWDELAGDLLAPLQVPRSPLRMARFGLAALRSAAGLARSRFEGLRARALLAGLAGHSVLPLERPASAAVAMVLGAAGHAVGWPLPRGGSQSIADALAGRLRSLGGRIETGRWVSSLDELPPARAYVLDVTPRQLLGLAGEHLPARYRRRLTGYRYGPGVFKMDWALAEPIPWRAGACRRAGTVHLGGTLEEIAASEAAVWRGELPSRPYVLLAQPTLVDPGRAPAGGHIAWAYCHVPSGCSGPEGDRTGAIEAQVERFAPGFRDLVLARHATDAAAMEAYNPNYVGGDINGGVQDLGQLLTRPVARRVPYSTPNPRIWLCSSATPPGGGVHGMCGYHAARALLRLDRRGGTH
ncbi:MAG: phytoene desaturase family protein [bacterium]